MADYLEFIEPGDPELEAQLDQLKEDYNAGDISAEDATDVFLHLTEGKGDIHLDDFWDAVLDEAGYFED